MVLSQSQYEKLIKDAEFGRSIAALQDALADPRPDIALERAALRLRAKIETPRRSEKRGA